MLLSDIHRERVKSTADLIRARGPEHFDMTFWVSPGNPFDSNHDRDAAIGKSSAHEVFQGFTDFEIDDCGTTACLCGWAAIARLRAEGLPTQQWSTAELGRWLGLPWMLLDGELHATEQMFSTSTWPDELRVMVDRLLGTLDEDDDYDTSLQQARWAALLDFLDGLVAGARGWPKPPTSGLWHETTWLVGDEGAAVPYEFSS